MIHDAEEIALRQYQRQTAAGLNQRERALVLEHAGGRTVNPDVPYSPRGVDPTVPRGLDTRGPRRGGY